MDKNPNLLLPVPSTEPHSHAVCPGQGWTAMNKDTEAEGAVVNGSKSSAHRLIFTNKTAISFTFAMTSVQQLQCPVLHHCHVLETLQHI